MKLFPCKGLCLQLQKSFCFIQQISGAQHAGATDQLESMQSHVMDIASAAVYYFAIGQAQEQ